MFDGNSQILIAFLLGIAVAVNPCILAANISALSYLTEDNDKKEVKLSRGILFILGRMIAFIVLGICISLFAGYFNFSDFIEHYVGKAIGPLFLIIGVLLLCIKHIHSHAENNTSKIKESTIRNKYWTSLVVGFVVAFALCPEGAALYFSSMVPLLLKCSLNIAVILSIAFTIGAIIPAIIITVLLISGSQFLIEFKNKHGNFEMIFRKVVAFLFIIAGIMFVMEYYFE